MPSIYAEVWYRRKARFTGDPNLDALNAMNTHVHVHNVQIDLVANPSLSNITALLDYVYSHMQGEIWSPHGEAKPILARRGIHHTSMSIGDIVVLPTHTAYECSEIGWRNIGKMVAVPSLASISGL